MSNSFSNPESVIDALHLPEGALVADFGAGSGYFTVLIGEAVGPNGLVTAVDVLPSALAVVSGKARDRGLSNVTTVRGNLETPNGSTLPDASQDMVLLANILFQSQKKDLIIKEARRVLKKNGRLVMIDWLPHTSFGPAEKGWKFSPEEGRALAEEAGFSFVRTLPVSSNHWGAEFTK